MAMAIFAMVATALAGVLVSSISARSIASERTAAEQIANDQLEWIRSIDYDDVGQTTDGNPVGIVEVDGDQSAQGGPTVPAKYTVVIEISWVDDAVPTSYSTKASYKNVVVTVSRARDSKQLTQQSTQVGPRQRAALGGINKGIVNVQVTGYPPETAPFPDVLVRLDNGPSSPLADTTDVAGAVRFPALDPATGSSYYDLVVPSFNGYILLPDPSVTHFQLAAGATPSAEGPAGVQACDACRRFRQQQRHALRRDSRLHGRELPRIEELHVHGDAGHRDDDHELDHRSSRAARAGDVHDHRHESGSRRCSTRTS